MRAKPTIAPEVTRLLVATRKRIKRFVVIDAILATLGFFLGAFWIGFLIDQTPVRFGGTEMPRLARAFFLGITSVIVLVTLIRLLVRRLLRPLPDASLALLIERRHPEIGGRLTTAVELIGKTDSIDDHSKALLAKVHDQATSLVDSVDPQRLLKKETLVHKSLITGPLFLAVLGFIIFDPNSFVLAARRLTLLSDTPWPRRADIEIVGIELPLVVASDEESDQSELIPFKDRTVRLPIGSSSTLRIRANAVDSELPSVCTLYYQTESGSNGQSNMRRVGRVTDGYQYFILDGPPLTDLSESFTLSIRGLDDRLDDFRVEAVAPPSINEAVISVKFPNYLKTDFENEFDWERKYQTGIRVEEGSEVELTVMSTTALSEVDLWIQGTPTANSKPEIRIAPNGLSATLELPRFQTPSTISLVPRDTDNISAQAPYRYFIGVINDEPPEMNLTLEGIGSAITANARIPMKAVVIDDYGAERSAVHLRVADKNDENEVTPAPADTDKQKQASASTDQPDQETLLALPDGSGESLLVADLRQLVADNELEELVPGSSVDLIGETNDRYDLNDSHTTITEVYRLPVVTPETLLAYLERRELSLRARLEQSLDESRQLRQNLTQYAAQSLEENVDENSSTLEDNATEAGTPDTVTLRNREQQIRRLRIQQSILQSQKTKEELTGIQTSLDDILLEMQNNRVDSVDRQKRLGEGVRDPLGEVITGSSQTLLDSLERCEETVADPVLSADTAKVAVEACDTLILELTAILEKMLDLESYNEILDLVRGLIDDQSDLMEDTKTERKKQVLDLFK